MEKLTEIIDSDLIMYDIQYRVHSTKRMFQRNVNEEDVLHVLSNGDIIERYDDDFPFPSVLINGLSVNGRPLHIVVGIDISQKRLYIITVYEPELKKWTFNFSRRIQ